MIEKKPLDLKRIRKISGSFAFIEHRFLRDGFWATLGHRELLLYLFLVLVADRKGLSYYGYDKICSLLRISVEEYMDARDALIDQDLVAFDGTLFQVLSLPKTAGRLSRFPVRTPGSSEQQGPVHIGQLLAPFLKGTPSNR